MLQVISFILLINPSCHLDATAMTPTPSFVFVRTHENKLRAAPFAWGLTTLDSGNLTAASDAEERDTETESRALVCLHAAAHTHTE